MEQFALQSKPLIRWAGSKRKLLPTLIRNIPPVFDRYVEPFCGSACLFFEINAPKALLSDINNELINALTEIKTNQDLHQQLINLPKTKDFYYSIRSQNPENLSKRERAVRFLYLNRYCFNGVYRTNKAGQFNVPRGTRTGDFPTAAVFQKAQLHLRDTELVARDYKDTLTMLTNGDFAYIDPPYSKGTKFTGEYGPGSFNGSHLTDLHNELNSLHKRGVLFLLSYRACEETISSLEENYYVQRLSVKRHISGFKKSWQDAQEILVRNYDQQIEIANSI